MSVNALPAIGEWLNEISLLEEAERPLRLKEMVAVTKKHGGCGSLQTANGLPCRRCPKIGYTVCRKHGERAPQTIARAERLLAVSRMPAIEWLLDALDQAQEEVCDACGYPHHGLKERKRIDAMAFKLLDRTGFGPRSTIDLNARTTEAGIDVSSLSPSELHELDELLASMDRFRARVLARKELAPGPRVLLPSVSVVEALDPDPARTK